ncbi:type II toxin-antitoxin system HicB family antitoxin [Candidatus Oscillochloris fontis]|uniref:type II toxin-antitoxin system HicB family antitoxin n=1 Tax=Candidatus Oscillochloris fontis TaxID=2496868 RepID=UPI0015842431|nr:type II toxin-antitoxin system HicB family antitoxin [Candidatus Oscillochloris fontis]
MNLTAVYVRQGEWIAAWIAEMPGVNTQAVTMEEARVNLRDALEMMLEDLRAETESELVGQEVIEREVLPLAA